MSDVQILDIDEGVSRVVNNRNLYGKLLLRFAETMGDAPDKIAALMAQNSCEEAVRLAHTVKGSAANLSAHALAEAAREVEVALRQSEPMEERLQNMRGVLDTTLAEMAEFKA
ncbi:MAG: Hpt domain-containing protein [Desulfovibrionaceae bacterium]